MCVVILCKGGYDVINFEVMLIFLIKPFVEGNKNFFLEGESPILSQTKSDQYPLIN